MLVSISFQFIFTKHGELNATHLQDISIGQKDFHKGLFFVLKSVFQLPKSSRRHFGFLQNVSKNGLAQNRLALSGVESETGAMQTSNSIRFHNILHLASSNSEFEKMAQGIYITFQYFNACPKTVLFGSKCITFKGLPSYLFELREIENHYSF